MCCCGNISGKVYYNGSQEGQITVVATKAFTENAVLELDGSKDFVIVPTIKDLSGSEITVQYWFRGSSFQSAVRNQQNGWIVAGWNNKHILSNDGGVSGVDAGKTLRMGVGITMYSRGNKILLMALQAILMAN